MIKFLHASTPKHFATSPIMYETFDEYILSLKKLISTIEKRSNIKLTIRYRSNIFCDFDNFKDILYTKNKNIIFKNDNKINEDLKNSNLIISFSSTVIEKALYLKKPVALFSINNKFNYLDVKKNKNNPIFKFRFNNLEDDINYYLKIKKNYDFSKYIYQHKKYKFNNFTDYLVKEIELNE